MKINDAEDAKKAQSAVVMKEFLQVEKIVSKEQPSKKEQELINSLKKKKKAVQVIKVQQISASNQASKNKLKVLNKKQAFLKRSTNCEK